MNRAEGRQWSREEQWVFSGLIVLALIFITLMSLILISSFQRRQIVVKYQAEQIFSEFLMQLRQNNDNLHTILENSPIRGLAIYDSRGNLLRRQFSVGSYPERIDLTSESPLAQGDIVYNREDNTLSFIRRAKITVTVPILDFSITAPSSPRSSEPPAQSAPGNSALDGMFPNSSGNSSGSSREFTLHDNWNLLGPIIDGSAQIQESLRIPEVLYIKIDGSFYRNQWAVSVLWYSLAFLVIFAFEIAGWRLYQKNRKYRRRLAEQEQLARLGEAARTLTHEIKNPLSAMMLQTAFLKKTLPEDKREDLRVMEEEIGRLDHLTKRISEFLKNPAGSPEPIALKSFVLELVQRFDAGISFSPQRCPDAEVFIDRERFRSVLENLIKNALESTQESGREPHVSVEIFRFHNDHWVSVDVLDRGDGLPDGDRNALFDPFFTTKVHGSGIGLAISLRFIEAAGGTLQLSSRVDGGTRARVKLLVYAGDQQLKKSRWSLQKRFGRGDREASE